MGFYGAFYSDGEISICMEHMVSSWLSVFAVAWEQAGSGLIVGLDGDQLFPASPFHTLEA